MPVATDYHDKETTPVLFGHHRPQGQPVISAGYAACLDDSVAKGAHGLLVRRDHSLAGMSSTQARNRSNRQEEYAEPLLVIARSPCDEAIQLFLRYPGLR